MVWTAERVFEFEFKLRGTAEEALAFEFEFKLRGTAEEALAQIDAQGYGVPYEADGRAIVKVGVEFDKAERNLGRWVVSSSDGA